MPYMYDIAAITAGIPLKQFYTDPKAMVQAQLALHDRVRQDVIAIGSDNFYITPSTPLGEFVTRCWAGASHELAKRLLYSFANPKKNRW